MSENYLTKDNIVLIANGEFPTHKKPLEIIKKNKYIICCDGAANLLIKFGRNPNIIIGDLDSIENDIKSKNIEKIIHRPAQDNNDFRKALYWISENLGFSWICHFCDFVAQISPFLPCSLHICCINYVPLMYL